MLAYSGVLLRFFTCSFIDSAVWALNVPARSKGSATLSMDLSLPHPSYAANAEDGNGQGVP